MDRYEAERQAKGREVSAIGSVGGEIVANLVRTANLFTQRMI